MNRTQTAVHEAQHVMSRLKTMPYALAQVWMVCLSINNCLVMRTRLFNAKDTAQATKLEGTARAVLVGVYGPSVAQSIVVEDIRAARCAIDELMGVRPDGLPKQARPTHMGRVISCGTCGQTGYILFNSKTQRSPCSMCRGWGWHPIGKTHDCKSNAEHIREVGSCLNEYKCKTCGSTFQIDSSD